MQSRLRRIALSGALTLVFLPSLFAQSGVTLVPDVIYGHKSGMALTFHVIQPESGANGAAVLFMMSGGWVSTWRPVDTIVGQVEGLLDRGFTVFTVFHGSSPQFKVPEAVDDVRRAVRFVRLHADEYGIDPDRIGVTGSSAGGHLSLVLGTASDAGDPQANDPVSRESSRVAAVVANFPPTDLRDWNASANAGAPGLTGSFPALAFDAARADEVSPVLHVTPDDAPTLLLHGDADRLVPLSHSQNILAELQAAGVPTELIVYEGAGHGFRGDQAVDARRALADWFEEHLNPR